MIKAAALIIGDEILGGKIQEANVFGLAKTLRERGVSLHRVVVVSDEHATIATEVKTLANQFDFVFTSGGIGPTHDDLTITAIADAFNVEVTVDAKLKRLLQQHYGAEFTQEHLLTARVPSGSRQCYIKSSPWPLTVFRNIWILPGIPEVFEMKLAIIRQHIDGDVRFFSRALYTKLNEVTLKPLLDDIVAKHPVVDIGSYPSWQNPDYETKITFDSTQKAQVQHAFNEFCSRLPDDEPQTIK